MDNIESALLPLLNQGRKKVSLDAEQAGNGLAQLVLTLIKLVHDLLERQALRRLEGDSLSDVEIERLGATLMHQAEEIKRLCELFGLSESDLKLDLGPLGKL